MAYYLLCERADESQPFAIEFGDSDKATVEAERQDYRDHDKKAKNLRVIKAKTKRQSDCNAAIVLLNNIVDSIKGAGQ